MSPLRVAVGFRHSPSYLGNTRMPASSSSEAKLKYPTNNARSEELEVKASYKGPVYVFNAVERR